MEDTRSIVQKLIRFIRNWLLLESQLIIDGAKRNGIVLDGGLIVGLGA